MSLGAKDPPRRTSAYASTILGLTSLAGYWRLGDASGTTAVDAKGTQNGTYTEDAGATAPELAQVGLMQTLALEGRKSGIRVNCLAPSAATQMTEGLYSEDDLKGLSTDLVTRPAAPRQ